MNVSTDLHIISTDISIIKITYNSTAVGKSIYIDYPSAASGLQYFSTARDLQFENY